MGCIPCVVHQSVDYFERCGHDILREGQHTKAEGGRQNNGEERERGGGVQRQKMHVDKTPETNPVNRTKEASKKNDAASYVPCRRERRTLPPAA